MKISIHPLAAAVSLALISASAHAALAPPAIGTAPPASSGLYLAVFDASGTNSDVVNLSYDASVVSAASGNLAPTSAGGPFSLATNPTGAAGQVLQLSFGVIPGFSTVFNTGNLPTSQYMVLDAVGGGPGVEEFQATSATTPITAYSGVGGAIINITGEIANWAGDTAANTKGFVTDTTGTSPESPQGGGQLHSGQLITGQTFSGAVGSALNFYDITTTSAHKSVIGSYNNGSALNGFWFLSTAGVLTYNIGVQGGTSVPLPAAVWLLGSGLLGLAGIGRRRIATA